MIYGVVLAGGTGTRMKNGPMPKQFIKLSGVPTIILTIKRMLLVERFDVLIIAIHQSWVEYMNELIAEYIDDPRIRVIPGGAERLDSIANAVNEAALQGVGKDDVIVLHDAVRPFVPVKVLEDSIDGALAHDAVVAAVPAVDTMLWIEEGTIVSDMPDRSKLYHGQAPDSFRLEVLKRSLESLTDEDRKIITGTAQICMLKGIEIHTIPGDRNNIKLTTPEDLITAEGLLKEEQ